MEKIIAKNKSAYFEYFILEKYEAGVSLTGTEIKSLRNKACNINDSYIAVKNNEVFILNMHIAEYKMGNIFNHDPYRSRKLLLHKKEILKMSLKVKQEGMTIIPLKIYFNSENKCKIEIALVKGKKLYDKRESIKERDTKRDIQKKFKNIY